MGQTFGQARQLYGSHGRVKLRHSEVVTWGVDLVVPRLGQPVGVERQRGIQVVPAHVVVAVLAEPLGQYRIGHGYGSALMRPQRAWSGGS